MRFSLVGLVPSARGQLLDAGRHGASVDDQLRGANRQAEPSRSGAAGIHVEHTRTFDDERLVRVAGDNDAYALCPRVDVERLQIVHDVYGDLAEADQFGLAKSRRPSGSIDVAADGRDRRNPGQRVEDGW